MGIDVGLFNVWQTVAVVPPLQINAQEYGNMSVPCFALCPAFISQMLHAVAYNCESGRAGVYYSSSYAIE